MVFQVSKCPFLSFVVALFLCGTPNGLFGQMLYVGNAGDNTISSYVIDQESGLLTELLPRVATTGSPSSVAVHPSGKYVYVTNGGNAALGVNGPSIAIFSINPDTGALTLASSVSLTLGTGPQGATIDPAGKFLFFANSGPGNVSVYAINASTGTLSPVPGSPFAGLASNSKVVVHPSGKFAYVSTGAAATTGQIAAFGIGDNGALSPIAGSPFAARNNMIWMTMDPAGKFLFAVERQDNAVLVYSVNATTGALTQVGSPFTAAPGVSGVAVDPAGKFLYVSTFGTAGVNVFNIGATGTLTQSRNFGSIIGAFDAILDPSGKFLYVTGQTANALAALAIDANSGAVSPLPQQFFPAGVQPTRGATVLLSPPVIPPISANPPFNYSHAFPGAPNAGIAQGSSMAISGQNIGPAAGVSSDFPLKTELGGASIQIQSGDVTTAALMVFASNNFVTCVVPSTTPLGDATVTVTYKGRTTAPVPVTIVPVSVGLRTLNDQGSGPAQSWILPPDTPLRPDPSVLQTPDTLKQSVKPGQLVVVQATGLGPVTFDETQNLFQELSIPADAIVGNKPASVVYQLRVAQGNDFIVFKVPDDAPAGCYVPIAIRAGGVTSNVASISVSATGGSCSDPGGLSAADIDAAQKSGQIRMGTILLNHIVFGAFGADDSATGVFARYDFNSLLRAFAPGNNSGRGIRTAFPTPPLGTCSVIAGPPTKGSKLFDTPTDPIFPQLLNVGQALNFSGPAGRAQLPAPDYSFEPDGIKSGDYTVDNGTGTQAVGAFKAVLNVPPMVNWANKDALASPDRTQDLTVTWSGGNPDKEFALIAGVSVNQNYTGGFLCAEKVSAGQFTVPAWVLSTMPKSDLFADGDQTIPGGILGVGTASLTDVGRFSGPGLDFGVFTYEQSTVSLVLYQ